MEAAAILMQLKSVSNAAEDTKVANEWLAPTGETAGVESWKQTQVNDVKQKENCLLYQVN